MPRGHFFNIPPKYSGDVKVYTATTGVNVQGYQIWQKPKGATIVYMVAIAGGGGGGGGHSRAAGGDGGGGAGGACSGITRFNCPAILLPDTLYIQVGGGGLGGAATANGTAGLNSYILLGKTNASPNLVCYSGVNTPGGGTAGTGAAAGTGGTVPTIATIQAPNIWGEWLSNVGLVGVAGGAQTGGAGTVVTAWGVIPLSPGAGGGGSTGADNVGGNVNATALLDIGNQGYYPTGGGGIALGGQAGVGARNGSAGVNRITPLFCSGGAGGATNDGGVAGDGGAGGYGCGGGGGGAGTTGGRGGNGGSGLVIIVTV